MCVLFGFRKLLARMNIWRVKLEMCAKTGGGLDVKVPSLLLDFSHNSDVSKHFIYTNTEFPEHSLSGHRVVLLARTDRRTVTGFPQK